MSKREALVISFISILAVIISINFFSPLGFDNQEFDYTSGKIRIRHRVLGFTYSIRYEQTWIEQYALSDRPSQWTLMGYRNAPNAPSIHTKSASLYSQIRSFGTALDLYYADEPTRRLVADFIFRQLDRSRLDPSTHYDVVDTFRCFGDVFPNSDDLDTPVTYDQILQVINNCSNP